MPTTSIAIRDAGHLDDVESEKTLFDDAIDYRGQEEKACAVD